MTNPWILVTPASRGIGFEIVRRLLTTTKLPVVATARANEGEVKSKLLEGLDAIDRNRLDVLPLDVTDEKSIESAASFTADKFSSSYLHLAYAIPGILYPEKNPSQIDAENALETLRINTLGPLLLAKHFIPQLPSKKTKILEGASSAGTSGLHASIPPVATFAIMAARVGSISDNRAGGWYSYRASKAGVMQLAHSLNIWLQMSSGGKAISVGLHPGTVKTGLSKDFWNSVPKDQLFEPSFAAEKLVGVVGGLNKDAGGKTWDWKGTEVPP